MVIEDTPTVGDFLVAPQLLHGRDLLFLCGERFASQAAEQHGLHIATLPWELPSIPIKLAWHRRTSDDPLLAWTREVIVNSVSTVI